MQEWPLTGRADEFAVITDALATDGEHAGVALAGAAGVGKTRLAREAVAAASARGWTAHWVVGTAAAQQIPLGAFAQWADRLTGHPLQLVTDIIAAVTAAPTGSPVLVAVDDAHRLDDLSAFVIHQLVLRRMATVIVTVRTGETAPDAVTALWKDGHLRRLDLAPLSRTQSDALLQNALGGRVAAAGAARAWQVARGNVLFLHEIVSHELDAGRLTRHHGEWTWAGPATLSPALADLVGLQLGQATRPVLDVVDLVTLAEPLELVHLAALADAQAIEESERRGLITVTPGTPDDVARLGHPLFGEVRLSTAGRWRLTRLRARLAQALTTPRSNAGPPDPVRLALLWLDSSLPPDGDVFVRGARTALHRMDVPLAARLAEAAVNGSAGVEARLMLAHTLSLLSRGAEADTLLEQLIADPLPDELWATAVSLRAANLLWTLGRPEASSTVITGGLGAGRPACEPALSAFRTVQLATAARPADAVRLADTIDRGRLGPLPAMMLAWAEIIAHGDLGDADRVARAAADGNTLAADSPEVSYQGGGLAIFHVDALVLGGYLEAANAVARSTGAACADIPGPTHTHAVALEGMAALACGDIRSATAMLGAALSEYARAGSTVGTAYHFGISYARALALAGDPEAATRSLAGLRRDRHNAFAFIESEALLAEAWCAAAGGRLPEARAHALRAAEYANVHGQFAREVWALQAAIQFGDTRHAERLAELAQWVGEPRAPVVARWAAGIAGDDGAALLAVSAELEALGDRVAAADAAAHAALAHQRHHRRGAAMTAAGRASRIIAECCARTPATQAAAMPLPLSRREREIALLVSTGLSNKEIADSLTVSIRTVEGHVYQACRKLGLIDRTGLARVVSASTSMDYLTDGVDPAPRAAKDR